MRSRTGLLLASLLLLAGCSATPGDGAGERPTTDESAVTDTDGTRSAPTSPAAALGLRAGWGPTAEELDRAARDVRRLPLPALAGQLIVARYDGTRAPVDLVRRLHLGGVVAFEENVASAAAIRTANRTLHSSARSRGWPLFVAVDQEGGLVARLRHGVTPLPAFMSTGAARDVSLTAAAHEVLGRQLRGLGFTVDLAPVADVTVGPQDPTIGSRSAGSDPEVVARQVLAGVEGLSAGGVVPVAKHFPGHGSVSANSHQVLPVQRRSLRRLAAVDLVPFRRLVAAGASSVMIAHLDVRAVDPGVPSSLSRPVITGLLRERLGFDGLVVTDALDMAGVAATHDSAAAAVAAVRAGADVVLMPPDPAAARAGLVRAVRSGRLTRGRLQQAAARQVALLRHQSDHPPAPGRVPDARASAALSRAAVTLLRGPCRGRLVGRTITLVGDAGARPVLVRAARRAGLRVGRGGTRVDLLGYGDRPRAGSHVAVALDTPYVLARSSARVRLATYGVTDGAMRALVDVLTGRMRAIGRPPVRVAGLRPPRC
ncbi:glycoside hydrolase family 3 protein [Nocardioides pacificus]